MKTQANANHCSPSKQLQSKVTLSSLSAAAESCRCIIFENRTRSSAQSELPMSVYQYIVILHSCCTTYSKWYEKLGRIEIKRCQISWQTLALPLVFETHLSKKWQHQIELLMPAILLWPSSSALSDATAVEICPCMFLTIKKQRGVQNTS